MSGARKALPAEDVADQATLGVTQDEILAFMDGINVRTPIHEGEFMCETFAERRGINKVLARRILVDEIKAGRVTRRQATEGGRPCYAYSLVKTP